MRFATVVAAFLAGLAVHAETPAGPLWTQLAAKREMLPALHQEFDATRTFKTDHGDQAHKYRLIVDAVPGKWREKTASGSGDRVRVFDGTNIIFWEEGGEEYVRVKQKSKDASRVPSPYDAAGDWSRATETGRQPCEAPLQSHTCVTLDAPVPRGLPRVLRANEPPCWEEARERSWMPTPVC